MKLTLARQMRKNQIEEFLCQKLDEGAKIKIKNKHGEKDGIYVLMQMHPCFGRPGVVIEGIWFPILSDDMIELINT